MGTIVAQFPNTVERVNDILWEEVFEKVNALREICGPHGSNILITHKVNEDSSEKVFQAIADAGARHPVRLGNSRTHSEASMVGDQLPARTAP